MSGSPAEVAEGLRRFRSSGANQFQLRFVARSASELCDQIERFGAEVWPQVFA